MVFPVVRHGCEGWTIKKAEWRRIYAFELWCCRRLSRVPWTARRSNQSILKEISPEDAEAETPVFWPPDAKNRLIGKDFDAGKDWRWEEKWTTEDEMIGWHPWCNGHEFEQGPGVGDGQGSLACWSPWVAKSWTQLSDWTELKQGVQKVRAQKTQTPQWLSGKGWSWRVRRYVTSLWTFFWLVGGEVMGVNIINLLVPISLGFTCCGQHTVNFSHLVGVSVSEKQLKG